ncbi:MAG: hypothetical protein BGP13_11405 [Sphingobacteriales bacterium 40-81]|nr:MAG: hypothetical protein BGP13_11405 [Sphingobacteriales bacterium 40-81]
MIGRRIKRTATNIWLYNSLRDIDPAATETAYMDWISDAYCAQNDHLDRCRGSNFFMHIYVYKNGLSRKICFNFKISHAVEVFIMKLKVIVAIY